ncbi:MAG: hypothetical protein CME59_02225 [Halioglobus sp.]|nr:hypothetical protein [Halioglobus sp.]
MGAEGDEAVRIGRAALLAAFGHVDKRGGGVGAFTGSRHLRTDGQGALPARRLPVDRGDGKKVPSRTAATRVSVVETRNSGRSRPLLADSQQLTAFVHRCISELTEMEQLWVHFCYRDRCHKRSECWASFLHRYARQYEALYCAGVRAETRAVIREMVAWRMGQMGGEIPWDAKFSSSNRTITRQMWSNTYRQHWAKVCDDLDRVDRMALFKIGYKVGLQ